MQKTHIGLFLIVLMTVSVVAPLAATRAQASGGTICSNSMTVVPTNQVAPFNQPEPPRITSVQAGSHFYVYCYWWDNGDCKRAENAGIHIQYWDGQTWVQCGVGVTGTGGDASGKVYIDCTAPALSGDVKFRALEDRYGTVEHPFHLNMWQLPTGPGATLTKLFFTGHPYTDSNGQTTFYADEREVYKISGFVVDPDGNWGGGCATIQLYRQLPGQSSLTPWENVKTDNAGAFFAYDVQNTPGNVIYQATYPGDSLSRQPSSDTGAIFIRYKTTLSISEGGLIWRTFSGSLRNQNLKHNVPGATLAFYRGPWFYGTTVLIDSPTTNDYGRWSAGDTTPYAYEYWAEYGGNGTLSRSTSSHVDVFIFGPRYYSWGP